MIDWVLEITGFRDWPAVPWVAFFTILISWLVLSLAYVRICKLMGVRAFPRKHEITIGSWAARPMTLLGKAFRKWWR